LEFDPVATKIVNNADADSLLRPVHREGWSLDNPTPVRMSKQDA